MTTAPAGTFVSLELGRVATLELVNPPLNLLTRAVAGELLTALEALRDEPDVRAVVVSGAGDRAFSVGSDVHEFEPPRGGKPDDKLRLDELVGRRLAELPMPTIAAVEGDALGGGLELALCCDLRVASEHARLGLPEVRLAVIPGGGGTQRLPRIVGTGHAKDLILTGRLLSAVEAERIGLVNRVVPTGQARAAARAIAEEIASRGPRAVREAKRLIDAASDLDVDAGLAAELEASERVFATEDMLEGKTAFFAKRDPHYLGR